MSIIIPFPLTKQENYFKTIKQKNTNDKPKSEPRESLKLSPASKELIINWGSSIPHLQKGVKILISNGATYKYIQSNKMHMQYVISEGTQSKGDKMCA